MSDKVWITVSDPSTYELYVDGVKVAYQNFVFCVPKEVGKQFAENIVLKAEERDPFMENPPTSLGVFPFESEKEQVERWRREALAAGGKAMEFAKGE